MNHPERQEPAPKMTEREQTKAAIAWFREHEEEIRKEKLLEAVWPVFDALKFIDLETLDLDYSKDKNLLAYGYWNHFCEQNNVDYSAKATKAVEILTHILIKVVKEEDATYGWLQSYIDQSKEGNREKLAGLMGTGGVWEFKMTPDEPTETGGAEEMQKAVAQWLIEMARNQSETATKKIPKLAGAPDPSGREKYQEDGANVIKSATNHELSWQESNPALLNIDTSKTTGELEYNCQFRIIKGTPEYFKNEVGLENKLIRLYREKNEGEYLDVLPNELLGIAAKDLQMIAEGSDTLFAKDRVWQKLPPVSEGEIPDLEEEIPMLGVFIGHSPDPDSAIARYGRSGQAITYLHFDTDKGTLRAYFTHLSFDGSTGKDWALAIAETLGATQGKREGLAIECYPTTQFVDLPSRAGLSQLRGLMEMGSKNPETLDDERLRLFVMSLGLSDLSISNEMPTEVYQEISALAEEMNKQWYDPAKEVLQKMMIGLPDEVQKIMINRLALTKMTPTKVIDMFIRNFRGPTAVCMLPRTKDVRLITGSVKEWPTEMRQLMQTYTAESKRPVFGQDTKDRSFDLKRVSKETRDDNVLEYAEGWTTNMTALGVIQRSVNEFRTMAEVTAYVLLRKLLESLQVEAQTSHMGVVERKKGGKVVAKLDGFGSAQTTAVEHHFTEAFSTITLDSKTDKEKVRYCSRVRLTPKRLDGLRMSDPTLMEPLINQVCNELEEKNEIVREDKKRQALLALKACQQARMSAYREKADDRDKNDLTVSNLLIVIQALEPAGEAIWERAWWANKKNLAKVKKRREDLVEGIKILTIAGLVEEQNRLMEVSSKGSSEIKMALQA